MSRLHHPGSHHERTFAATAWKQLPEKSLTLRLGWQVVIAAAFLQFHTTQAQPVVRWAKTGGTGGYSFCHDMALSSTGVLHLTVVKGSTPEVVLLRFDSTGASVDSQASRGEAIRGVAVDAAGNYFLTGRVWDPDRLGQGTLNDFYLGKFSSSGALIWERTLGSSGAEARRSLEGGFAVALDEAGNIYVTGGSGNVATFGDVTFPNTPGGPLLCKFDPTGRLRAGGRHLTAGAFLGSHRQHSRCKRHRTQRATAPQRRREVLPAAEAVTGGGLLSASRNAVLQPAYCWSARRCHWNRQIVRLAFSGLRGTLPILRKNLPHTRRMPTALQSSRFAFRSDFRWVPWPA